MGFVAGVGRRLRRGAELLGQILEVVWGFGLNSRSTGSRERRRRDTELERLVRLHESGTISRQEFERRRRRLG